MIKYWVYILAQNEQFTAPWSACMETDCETLDAAKIAIENYRKEFRILSAWIEKLENGEKQVVFLQCYVDAFGMLKKIN